MGIIKIYVFVLLLLNVSICLQASFHSEDLVFIAFLNEFKFNFYLDFDYGNQYMNFTVTFCHT